MNSTPNPTLRNSVRKDSVTKGSKSFEVIISRVDPNMIHFESFLRPQTPPNAHEGNCRINPSPVHKSGISSNRPSIKNAEGKKGLPPFLKMGSK